MPKHVNKVDRVVPRVSGGMSREQDKRHVTDVVVYFGIGVLELPRRLSVAEEYRWSRVRRSQAFFQLLHEHLPDYDVIFVTKPSGEDYGYSVCFSLYISEVEWNWVIYEFYLEEIK